MRINLTSVASGVAAAEKITGVKTFVEPIVGSITGSAGSANKLSVPRTINGVPFDGTADIAIPTLATEKGVAGGVATLDANGFIPSSQIPDYIVPSVNTALNSKLSTTGNAASATKLNTARTINGVAFDGTANITITDNTKIPTTEKGAINGVATLDSSGKLTLSQLPPTGVASTAEKLTTARSISATGDASFSVTFDGSVNVSSPITLANSGVTAGSYGSASLIPVLTVDAKGRLTSVSTASVTIPSGSISVTGGDITMSGTTGAAITNAVLTTTGVTAGTYKSLTVDTKGRVTAGTNPTTLAGYGITDAVSTTGNAASATKLNTARTINGVAFDGTANITINAVDSTARIAATEKGVANGVATLDGSGKVPASQLPSFVDDVIEAASFAALPATGESSKIYTTLDTDKIYRWGGSTYIEINPSAGTTDTANRLAAARTISTTGDATFSVSFDGSTNVSGPITLSASGVTAGTYNNSATTVTPITVDAKGRVTGTGTPVTITPSFASLTGKPTTLEGYGISVPNATTSVSGLMSNSDKSKLDGIATNANNYAHPTGDGNLHVPATGTTNAGKVLTAGATAGSLSWVSLPAAPVSSVAGRTGAIVLAKADVGLGNVDDTADSVKVVASAAKLTTARTISTSGDATFSVSFDGSGNVSGPITLSASGVTAGTYNNSATTVTPITVDAKGRVTGTGTPVTITPSFASLTGKPTTLEGYGITDALTAGGTAVAAAKLATARTINGVAFDGTANITITDNTKISITDDLDGGEF